MLTIVHPMARAEKAWWLNLISTEGEDRYASRATTRGYACINGVEALHIPIAVVGAIPRKWIR
jgi:hypothetical protein